MRAFQLAALSMTLLLSTVASAMSYPTTYEIVSHPRFQYLPEETQNALLSLAGKEAVGLEISNLFLQYLIDRSGCGGITLAVSCVEIQTVLDSGPKLIEFFYRDVQLRDAALREWNWRARRTAFGLPVALPVGAHALIRACFMGAALGLTVSYLWP